MSSTARGRKAAVLGSPIAHSRSPQLHLAAYRALGLHDWTYDRIECGADELPAVVSGFGRQWVGVSVTMPGKLAALRFADEHTTRADLVGSANTLVRTPHGWRADNTDVDGVTGALGAVTGPAVVLGAGGT
ncbi:MAG: shikimate dehydrogenase, partial [Mycobacterium sp.]